MRAPWWRRRMTCSGQPAWPRSTETKARLGELVDEISTQLSADPDLQQAVSDGVSSFVVSGVKATRLAERGRIDDAQRELQQTFDPNLLAYVISTVTAPNGTSSASLSGVLAAGQRDFWIALGFTGVLVLIAAFAAFWAFRAVRGSVIEPVQYAALTARRLATGDYAEVRCSEKPDECGDLVRAMRDLCQQLIERRTRGRGCRGCRGGGVTRALGARSRLLTRAHHRSGGAHHLRQCRGEIAHGAHAAGREPMNRSLDHCWPPRTRMKPRRPGNPATCACVSGRSSPMSWCPPSLPNRARRSVELPSGSIAPTKSARSAKWRPWSRAAGAGDFSLRIPAQGKSGYWEELARSLNQLTETFHSALHATSLQLAALSQGELTSTAGHRL